MLTRIAVFVSGGGTNLQALLDAEKAGKISSGKISLVVSSSPEAYALKRAERFGVPAVTVSKKEYGTQAAVEEKIKKLLKEYKIDLIVLAGFMTILSEDFTKDYPERIINVHPALIPSFCGKGYYGLRVHKEALARGVKVTGATVHFVNEIPDGGRIIAQKAVKVLDGDTPEALQKRVMRLAEWKILPEAVEKVSSQIKKEKEGK